MNFLETRRDQFLLMKNQAPFVVKANSTKAPTIMVIIFWNFTMF